MTSTPYQESVTALSDRALLEQQTVLLQQIHWELQHERHQKQRARWVNLIKGVVKYGLILLITWYVTSTIEHTYTALVDKIPELPQVNFSGIGL